MKILIVSQYYYPERFSVTDIAERLHSFGHEVSVLTGKPNYGFGRLLKGYRKVKYEVINGVKVHRVRLIPRGRNHFIVSLNYLSFYFNGLRFARHFKEDFDIVLSFSLSPVISIAPAIAYARRHHVPHVLFCEDLWPASPVVTGAIRMNSLLYRMLYRWSVNLYRKCDMILVSSPYFADYFRDVLKIKDKTFRHVCQPSLSTKDLVPDVKYKGKYNVVYAGNLGTLQLVDKLIEAMGFLRGEQITLHLAGMGSQLARIRKMMDSGEFKGLVEYHGVLPLAGVEAYYRTADALIVSLKSAGAVGKTIPNKAVQYMKYGRPMIGVLKGDGRDLLKKAGGTIFSEEDPKSIAEAIRKVVFLSDEEKRRLGESNRKYFEENLTAEKIAHAVEDALSEAMKRDKASP